MRRRNWCLAGIVPAIGLSLCCLAAAEEAEEKNTTAHVDGWGTSVDLDGNCEFRLDEGKLTIVVPGPVQDMSADLGRMNAPRVVRKVEGDFIAQVKVSGRFDPGPEQVIPERTSYHGAGLLLMSDLKNYVRLDRAAHVRGTTEYQYVSFCYWDQGTLPRPTGTWNLKVDEYADVILRVERRGDVVFGAVAVKPGEWLYLRPIKLPLSEAVWIGVNAVNLSTRNFEPQFESFDVFQPTDAAPPKKETPPEDRPPGWDGTQPSPKPSKQGIAAVNW